MCFVWLLTLSYRVSALNQKKASTRDILFVDKQALPQTAVLAGNSYDNQFQQSALFIVLLSLLNQQGVEGHFWYVISTVFVTARFWHAFEHIVCRNLILRTIAFVLGTSSFFIAWFAYIFVNLFTL